MTDRTRKLPPPMRRDRDVGGFSVEAGDLQATEENGAADLTGPGPSEAEPPSEFAQPETGGQAEAPLSTTKPKASRKSKPKPRRTQSSGNADGKEKQLRRRLIATVTPPTRELLEQRAKETRGSFADVLIDAWLNYADTLAGEYKPDAFAAKREQLGVRKPRHKRPPGRTDVQFYLTERELEVIEEGATAAGYEVRSAYIEELLVRALGAGS